MDDVNWKNLNRLLSDKSLDKMLEYLDGDLDESELSNYLTSSADEVTSLNQLTDMDYDDQQFYIYQMYMRKQLGLWLWVIKHVKFAKGTMIFMLKQFVEAGYETFPTVYCPGNRLVQNNVTLICTCLRVTLDRFTCHGSISFEKFPAEVKCEYKKCIESIRDLFPKIDPATADQLDAYLRRHYTLS